ncbi:MAG: TOTE conflict system archaeo-eukaryotic primase domain-containing protein, partial [Thermodesulforhabdaceae bacterium]
MNQENRKNSAPGATERSKIDWDLVLRRLKTFVLGEKELGKAERLVENENVWRKLPPDKAIEWAEVAQAMGKHELSLRIIEWVLREHPHYLPAWEAKTKLLEFLIARSSDASPAADDFNLEAYFDSPSRDGISKPFDEFRTFASYVANYMEIFKGREDCFARQWVDRERGVQGYTPVRRPLSEQDVVDHLRCKHTYGI